MADDEEFVILRINAPALSIPFVRVSVPSDAIVILLFIVTPLELFIVRFLRFVTPEGINTPDDDPPKQRSDDEVVVRFVDVPAIAGPLSVRLFEPTENIPLVKVRTVSMVTEADNSTPEELSIIKPPDPLNIDGSSIPDVWADAPLYLSVEEAPYTGLFPEAVAVPSIDNIPLIVRPEAIDFDPLPESVRFV